MAKKLDTFVVTASLTDDGAPAYMTADKGWTRELSGAAVLDAGGAEGLLAVALGQERQVCDPYTVAVAVDAGSAVAATARERIRAEGPTTRLRRPDPQGPAA